jgi:aromatic ring-opening dioxygenase catalytic subunit (LigB family)
MNTIYKYDEQANRQMKPEPNALFLSHGGGPLPLLGDAAHSEMVECLTRIASTMPKPRAIIVVSAHWEAAMATITSATMPPLIYDYYGFPEESYQIQYPCPGEPQLANDIHEVLTDAGIDAKLDGTRGFDHGLFVPLKIMYPDADIPCVQLSLLQTLDPAQHIEIGKALQGLAREDVLLIGSGFSFHNMKAFFTAETDETRDKNHSFESWLLHTCSDPAISEQERQRLLSAWANAPGARFCHPREEHLLPLHVCYGFARAPCTATFELSILNRKSSMYLW